MKTPSPARWTWLLVPLALASLVPLSVRVGTSDAPSPDRAAAVTMPGPAAEAPLRPAPARPASEVAATAPTVDLAAAAEPPSAEAVGLPELDCVMEPSELVHIGSPVEGLIERIHAERADYVRAGDVLVELDAGVEAAAVEVARARAAMKGEVLSSEAAVELGRRRTERVDALFQREAVSLDIHDEVETEARLARHALEHAREKRQLASLELDQARAILERRTIRSPIDGFVVDRHMAAGEVVDEQVILTVARVDPLRVEVIAPSSLYGSIREGMTAEIVPEIPGDRSLRAPVGLVDPVIDAASGTFGVRLELPNPDHAVPAGLRCRIRFLAADADPR